MKRKLKKISNIIIVFLIIMGLANKSFGVMQKPTNFMDYYIKIQPEIVANSLEWCVYMLLAAIFIFIISLIWLIILRIKKIENKTKKFLKWIFIISIMCIFVTSIIFIINGIDLDDFFIFFGI